MAMIMDLKGCDFEKIFHPRLTRLIRRFVFNYGFGNVASEIGFSEDRVLKFPKKMKYKGAVLLRDLAERDAPNSELVKLLSVAISNMDSIASDAKAARRKNRGYPDNHEADALGNDHRS